LDVNDYRFKELKIKNNDENADKYDFEHFSYLAQTLLIRPSFENLLSAFQILDRNNDRQLSFSDLSNIINTQENISPTVKEDMLGVTNLKNRRMEFSDFMKFIQSEENILESLKKT